MYLPCTKKNARCRNPSAAPDAEAMITCSPLGGGIEKSLLSVGVNPRRRTSRSAFDRSDATAASAGGGLVGGVVAGTSVVAVGAAEVDVDLARVVDETRSGAFELDIDVEVDVTGELVVAGAASDAWLELHPHIASSAADTNALISCDFTPLISEQFGQR